MKTHNFVKLLAYALTNMVTNLAKASLNLDKFGSGLVQL